MNIYEQESLVANQEFSMENWPIILHFARCADWCSWIVYTVKKTSAVTFGQWVSRWATVGETIASQVMNFSKNHGLKIYILKKYPQFDLAENE